MALYVDIEKKLSAFTLKVHFEAENEVLALLGSSGCGKSMTLKCIAGIECPDAGKIVMHGETWFDSEKRINLPPQKRRVGYMFQDYALFPHMTVAENIAVGIRGERKAQKAQFVAEQLKRFKLEEAADSYPGRLSGGQRQRTALARMLASEPQLLLMDEPFSALDSHLKWELERELSGLLKSDARPCIYVSHSRDEVYRLCDNVCVMAQGLSEDKCSVRDLFERPASRNAAILSGCKNIAEAEKTGEYEVYVPGWQLTLKTQRRVPDDLAYVGIRAHYLKEAASEGENTMTTSRISCTEEPFEWALSFYHGDSSQKIFWRVSKDVWQPGPGKAERRMTGQLLGQNAAMQDRLTALQGQTPDMAEMNAPGFLRIPPEHIMLMTK